MRKFIIQTGLYLLLILCLFGLCTGCSMPGEVFLSFTWRFDSDKPDLTFNCTAPRTMDNITDFLDYDGGYFSTDPGDFRVTFTYADDPANPISLDFTLEQDVTLFGKENAYYDIYINQRVPLLLKVPPDL